MRFLLYMWIECNANIVVLNSTCVTCTHKASLFQCIWNSFCLLSLILATILPYPLDFSHQVFALCMCPCVHVHAYTRTPWIVCVDLLLTIYMHPCLYRLLYYYIVTSKLPANFVYKQTRHMEQHDYGFVWNTEFECASTLASLFHSMCQRYCRLRLCLTISICLPSFNMF